MRGTADSWRCLQGIADQLFSRYFGYNSGEADIVGDVQSGPPLPFVVSPRAGIITENAVREVRRHLGCPTLSAALLENDIGAGAHWDNRLFRVCPSQPPPPKLPSCLRAV